MNNRDPRHLLIALMCWLSPMLASASNELGPTNQSSAYLIAYQGSLFDIGDKLQALQFRQRLKKTPGLLAQLEGFINTPLGKIDKPTVLNTIKQLLHNIQTAPELAARLNQAEQAHSRLRQHLKQLKKKPHNDSATQTMLSEAHQHLSARAFGSFHDSLIAFAQRLNLATKNQLQALAELSYLRALEYASRFMYQQAMTAINSAISHTNNNSRYWTLYGLYLSEAGNNELAIYAFEKALTLDPNYPNVAPLYTHLGQAHEANKNAEQAANNYAKALTININTLGEHHPQTALDYSRLASALKNKGEYEQALTAYQKALKIDLKLFALEHRRVAAHYNNLGTVWSLKGDPSQAINHYNKALNININIDGHDHIRVANRYYNIGLAWQAKGDANYATLHLTKALVIYLSNYGKYHPRVVRLYNSLGNSAYSQGHYDNAINYFYEGLDISRKIQPPNKPLIAQQYNNLGAAWKAKGDLDLAIEYYTQALISSLNAQQKNKTDLAAHYNNLANVWRQKGNNDQAIENYQKSLALLTQRFGDKHPATLPIENALNVALKQKNKTLRVVAKSSP